MNRILTTKWHQYLIILLGQYESESLDKMLVHKRNRKLALMYQVCMAQPGNTISQAV